MLRRVAWGFACTATIGASLIAADVAAAQSRDQELFLRPEDQRSAVFAGVDGGRSIFFSAGWKQTLVGPLDRTGYLTMETAGFGLTRERIRGAVDLPATRLTTQSSLLGGQQWVWPGLYVAALVGPELEHEQLTVAGRFSRFSKPRYGARGQIELWANPTQDTLLTGTVIGGSARGSLYARGSAGYRVGGSLYAGPEVTAYATETYREYRVGGHLTGLAWGIVQGRLSAGWMMTDDGRRGTPYVGVAAWIRL